MKRGSFIAGLLTGILLLGMFSSAFAMTGKQTLEIDYSDIQIILDGNKITPSDAIGNPVEPFSYNGTTYLPVRAVSNALGLDVDWDATTHSVILTSSENSFLEDQILLLGYFHTLLTGFEDLETTYSAGFGSEWGIEALYEVGVTTLKNGVIDSLDIFESHYNACRDLLSDDDIALAVEYRRLANRKISMLTILENGRYYVSEQAISDMVSSSTQNVADCQAGKLIAENRFWEVYQKSFN